MGRRQHCLDRVVDSGGRLLGLRGSSGRNPVADHVRRQEGRPLPVARMLVSKYL